MGVYSTGNSYGVPEDLIYSFPVMIQVSLDLTLSPFFQQLASSFQCSLRLALPSIVFFLDVDFILNRVFVVLILFCLFLFKLKFALNKILGISKNIIDQRTKLKVLFSRTRPGKSWTVWQSMIFPNQRWMPLQLNWWRRGTQLWLSLEYDQSLHSSTQTASKLQMHACDEALHQPLHYCVLVCERVGAYGCKVAFVCQTM